MTPKENLLSFILDNEFITSPNLVSTFKTLVDQLESSKTLEKALKNELKASNPLRLSDVAQISNNSRITMSVLQSLNSKLSSSELNDFRRWIQIIQNK